MSQHLHADLARLEQQLLYLAARVEEAVRKAIVSLVERRQDPALDVIEGDQHIDRREVELEEECLKILALHRPVANDLRFVTAVLKIDNDLERIGDLAVNIAKRAAYITTLVPTPVPAKMREMMEEAMRILRDAVDAFVRGDAQAARRVCREDERVDRFHKEIVKDLQAQMESDRSFVSYGLLMYSVSKSLERIADHATNIAEDVVYMVEGEIIRHSFRGIPDSRPSATGRSI
jgi:phosphate transport system protein